MQFKDRDIRDSRWEEMLAAGESVLEEAAARMRGILAELAGRIHPFPAFLNMSSVQAVELDPPLRLPQNRGCVVVLPNGEICEMNLTVMPGIQGVMDIDQVEEFQELQLSTEEYIMYAAIAIRLLSQELHRHGG